jgi:rod shape-determining protein MreC
VVALDQQSRAMGEVQGQLGGQLVFVNVPVTEKLAPGETVVTAGLSLKSGQRSAYPKGLLIGTIQAVQPDQNALTQTAFVRPALDFQRVERLMVAISFSQD